jgi:O-antigen/teichoic acid export membrane protein
VAAGSVLMIISRIAVLGCGLILMGYLTRNLGLADYGRYALAVLLVNWAATSLALATGGALVRLVAGNHDGHRYAVSMLQLSAIAGAGLGLALFLTAGPIASALKSPGIADLLRILAIELPLGAMAGIHLGVLTARGKFLKNAGGVLAGWILQLAAAVAFVEGGLGKKGSVPRIIAFFSGFPERLPKSLSHSSIQFLRDPGHRHRGALSQFRRERKLVRMPFPKTPELIQSHPAHF